MAVRQVFNPDIGCAATRGWCLKYVDDAGKVANTAPPRTPNARTALNNEIKAGRLRQGKPPLNIWVVGFLDLRTGQYAGDDHVFLMKRLSDGKYEIRDSETNSGKRAPYSTIEEIIAWYGRHNPIYVGYSYACDGRVYAEDYVNTSITGSLIHRKGTATVIVDEGLNVRNEPNTKCKVQAVYTKGQSFNYDSYIIANGYVWLSYISDSAKVRRYISEGPYDGNPKNVWVKGGV